MTSRQPRFTSLGSSYELVDNDVFGSHEQALEWLANTYTDPLNVATGYVSLEGLDSLAKIMTGRVGGGRLLIGATPLFESLTEPVSETVSGRFEQSVKALGRQRIFQPFPPPAALSWSGLQGSSRWSVEVRRYAKGFLHGKAYIFGDFDGQTSGTGAALVSSANLTYGGLVSNRELGMVHYQPNVVAMALDWYQRLWDDALDFREELLELLRPPSLESDPQTVFLRALLELYESDLGDDGADLPGLHTLTSFQRDGLARAKRILDEHGSVLYADGVGMGKTEIGVQFIREHTRDLGQHVLVISPAQL